MIEEVAGAVKDLIKAGRVRQFGMSEAAAGTIRQPKERRGRSDQHADGDVDTAAPDAGSSTGLTAGCGWPVRTLTGCRVWAVVVVAGAAQCGVCELWFVNPLVG